MRPLSAAFRRPRRDDLDARGGRVAAIPGARTARRVRAGLILLGRHSPGRRIRAARGCPYTEGDTHLRMGRRRVRRAGHPRQAVRVRGPHQVSIGHTRLYGAAVRDVAQRVERDHLQLVWASGCPTGRYVGENHPLKHCTRRRGQRPRADDAFRPHQPATVLAGVHRRSRHRSKSRNPPTRTKRPPPGEGWGALRHSIRPSSTGSCGTRTPCPSPRS